MKKIVLFIFVAVFGVMTVTAQEVDSLQTNDLSARVDSLSMELKQLRHDYDYLCCEYKLHSIAQDLQILINQINSQSNAVQIYDNHGNFNMDLYRTYKLNYESSLDLVNSHKILVESVKTFVALKISTSDFTDAEIRILKTNCVVIDRAVVAVETSLNRYKVSIASYLM